MSDFVEQCSECFCMRDNYNYDDPNRHKCYKDYPEVIRIVDRQAVCRHFRKMKAVE